MHCRLWNTIYRTIITSFFPNGTFTNRMYA